LESTSGFLALDLIEEHLTEIQALWVVRRRALFSKRWNAAEVAGQKRRIDAHLAGLRVRPEESVEQAGRLLYRRHPIQVFAGVWTLLHLDPARIADEEGRLLLDRPVRFAIADAVAHAPEPPRPWHTEGDARLLDGATVAAPAPEEVVRAALSSRETDLRRAGMLAASRRERPSSWILERLRDEALEGPEGEGLQPVALYALGLLRPQAAAHAVDSMSDDARIAAVDASLVPALFATPAAAARIVRRAREEAPRRERLLALGLLGAPAALPVLADLVAHDDPVLADAATRAIHTLTGEVLVDGEDLVLRGDAAAAKRIAASSPLLDEPGVRFHLGVPLLGSAAGDEAPMSLRWLRSILRGADAGSDGLEPPGFRHERPDVLFGEGYGALAVDSADLGLPALSLFGRGARR
jgi:hypothetical protein